MCRQKEHLIRAALSLDPARGLDPSMLDFIGLRTIVGALKPKFCTFCTWLCIRSYVCANYALDPSNMIVLYVDPQLTYEFRTTRILFSI